MLQPEACATCGKTPPTVDTNYTLFSSKFGWRLDQHRNADGTIHIDWLCPDCWKARKTGPSRAPAASATTSERDRAPASSTRPVARRATSVAPDDSPSVVASPMTVGAQPREPKP